MKTWPFLKSLTFNLPHVYFGIKYNDITANNSESYTNSEILKADIYVVDLSMLNANGLTMPDAWPPIRCPSTTFPVSRIAYVCSVLSFLSPFYY